MTTPLRILIADDNHDGADTLSMLLQLMGHQTCVASDGAQAIAEAQAFDPQLVVMDIGMPIMDGLEATRRLRQLPKGQQMRIIAVTGRGEEEIRNRAREAGCDGHLTKPIDADQLSEQIDACLRQLAIAS